jgi:hypothetical protein
MFGTDDTPLLSQGSSFRRRNIGAAAHAGHQFQRRPADLAEHIDGLADRIDPAADPVTAAR